MCKRNLKRGWPDSGITLLDEPEVALAIPGLSVPADPVDFARELLGVTLDEAQSEIVRSTSKRIMLCMARRCGKSFAVALRALHFALTHPDTDTVVISRSQRQANIILGYIRRFLAKLGRKRRSDGLNDKSLLLPNESRIIALPPVADNIAGFGPKLLILDEAARIPDDVYYEVRPMLGRDNPDFILLSTPRGRRGFFYREWHSNNEPWKRVFLTAEQCPHISKEFLANERATTPEKYFRQEFGCEFLDSSESFFPAKLLNQAIDHSIAPFNATNINAFPLRTTARRIIAALDLGLALDYSAFCVLEDIRFLSDTLEPITMSYPEQRQLRLRHMERLPLETPYHEVVDHVVSFLNRLQGATGVSSIDLVVDATAVGTPVVEMFRKAKPGCAIIPVVITGGDTPTFSGDTHRIPKRDLMNHLHIALEGNTLRIPANLAALPLLKDEFQNFRLKYTDKGNDTYEGKPHDDLLVSLSLATWRLSCL